MGGKDFAVMNTEADITQLADKGAQRIVWAKRQMPLSESALSNLSESSIRHIGVSLSLNVGAACLCTSLLEKGFAVTLFSPTARSETTDLIAALQEKGVMVVETLKEFLAQPIEVLLDQDGALFGENLPKLIGGTILDNPGPTAINRQASKTPIVHLCDSELMRMTTDIHGHAQACVSGFLDITNLQLAGRNVLVLGYETLGQGIANYARAYGARVTILETKTQSSIAAHFDGYQIRSTQEAAKDAEVVFNTVANGAGLSLDQLSELADGSFLCSATPNPDAFSLTSLQVESESAILRKGVRAVTLKNGKQIKLINEGRPVQEFYGDGLPSKYADILVSAQIRLVELFASGAHGLSAGLQGLPSAIETAITDELFEHLIG